MIDEPLRVAMVSRRVHPAHGPGGMERKVFDLVCHLSAAGATIELFTETPAEIDRARAASAAMPEGVVIHWVPGRWLPIGDRRGTVVIDRITNYPLWTKRAARWMKASRDAPPTVVHAHGLAGLGFEAVDVGAPVVLSVEGLEEFEVPPGPKRWAYAPFRAGMRRAAAAATTVIATDRSLQQVVERHLGISVADQALIPNAVDTARCLRLADPERGQSLLDGWGLAGAAPLFVSVGRMVPNKGFDLLAQAFARAAPRLPATWAWVLIGDGPERERVESAAAGLGGRVSFAGGVGEEDLHGLLARADWFVHPTLYEGSSIATLEAMAHGLPVIATRSGGLPDKVIDGDTGFLVPPGDVGALADSLVAAAAADGEALGDAGRRLCGRRFSWSAIVEAYIDLYRHVAALPPGAPRR